MLTATSDPPASGGDPLAQVLAVAAIVISLLAVVVPAATGRQQRLRDDRAKRAEMYLELMELVELVGLWINDEAYNRTETEDPDYIDGMPLRPTERPPRSTRVRAKAIVSAYGSEKVTVAHDGWVQALEAFEEKLDYIDFIEHHEGRFSADQDEVKPIRDDELAARKAMALAVNHELVQQRWFAPLSRTMLAEVWSVLTGRRE